MKRIFAILLSCALAICFTACGESEQAADKKPDSDVVGIWKADVEGMTFYYEFVNGGKVTAYADSFTIEMNYIAEQKDDAVMLTVPMPDAGFGSVGILYPDTEGTFTVKDGSYDAHDRTAELRYAAADEESGDDVFTLTETRKAEPRRPEIPKDFKVDEQLTDMWINNYSRSQAVQALEFYGDGTMQISETYTSETASTSIFRSCTYSASNGKIILNYIMGEETSLPVEYSIDGDYLNFGGLYYTRAGADIPAGSATADEAAAEQH